MSEKKVIVEPRILAIDPWLRPYQNDLGLRIKRYEAIKKGFLVMPIVLRILPTTSLFWLSLYQ